MVGRQAARAWVAGIGVEPCWLDPLSKRMRAIVIGAEGTLALDQLAWATRSHFGVLFATRTTNS